MSQQTPFSWRWIDPENVSWINSSVVVLQCTVHCQVRAICEDESDVLIRAVVMNSVLERALLIAFNEPTSVPFKFQCNLHERSSFSITKKYCIEIFLRVQRSHSNPSFYEAINCSVSFSAFQDLSSKIPSYTFFPSNFSHYNSEQFAIIIQIRLTSVISVLIYLWTLFTNLIRFVRDVSRLECLEMAVGANFGKWKYAELVVMELRQLRAMAIAWFNWRVFFSVHPHLQIGNYFIRGFFIFLRSYFEELLSCRKNLLNLSYFINANNTTCFWIALAEFAWIRKNER